MEQKPTNAFKKINYNKYWRIKYLRKIFIILNKKKKLKKHIKITKLKF